VNRSCHDLPWRWQTFRVGFARPFFEDKKDTAMARHPTPNTTSDKTLSRRILVNIKRDMTEITPRVIWAHEKPLLEAIHEEGNVNGGRRHAGRGLPRQAVARHAGLQQDHGEAGAAVQSLGLGFVFIGNPEAEYQRLFDVYGRMPDENVRVVEKVYGRFQGGSFARLMGSPELDDLPEAQLRALVLDYGYAPEPHKDAAPDEKNEMWARRKALFAMGHAELVKTAQEVGVELG
jgi:hypothetical protein